MTRRAVESGEKFHAQQYLPNLISQGNFDTVDFFSAFPRTGGHNAQIDLATGTPPDIDLRRELLGRRVSVRTETDCLPRYCEEADRRTAYCYNRLPWQLVGNYENRACAQHVEEWRRTTFRPILGAYGSLTEDGLATVVWGYRNQTGMGVRMVSIGP